MLLEEGLVLILPSEPRPDCLEHALTQDDRPALKHYSWQELEGILETTSLDLSTGMVHCRSW
jgi:hypothetical protein